MLIGPSAMDGQISSMCASRIPSFPFTHFGDLGALKQLPGLAIQRLMEKGYGFGAEGDWKVAAMVRLMKVMTAGMKDAKGTSMLEDYTYNLVKGKEGILCRPWKVAGT